MSSMETASLELPTCRVCGVALMPQTGVAFRAGDRVLLVTCQEHAELVGDGVHLVKRLATTGLREFMQEKAPNLFGALQEVYEQHARLKEKSG